MERRDKTETRLHEYASNLAATLRALPFKEMAELVELLSQARLSGKSIYLFGNGGSASTASHFACDLGKGTMKEMAPRVKVVALSDNVPLITAWANDFSFDRVFSEQLANLVQRGDIVIGISTSGNSRNVLEAIDLARGRGAYTVGFVGHPGGRLAGLVDLCIQVPSTLTSQIEDAHLAIQHMISTCL